MSTALSIEIMESLTFKVLCCMRDMMLVCINILMGTVVTGLQLWGSSVSLLGSAL